MQNSRVTPDLDEGICPTLLARNAETAGRTMEAHVRHVKQRALAYFSGKETP